LDPTVEALVSLAAAWGILLVLWPQETAARAAAMALLLLRLEGSRAQQEDCLVGAAAAAFLEGDPLLLEVASLKEAAAPKLEVCSVEAMA